ncbi:MAG: MFS transporter [Gammaproteobacteria bacterium]|nr:MFS transporter [Gammaproteobacteria bacterium]
MLRIAVSIFSLLFSVTLLLNGMGLLGTLVGLRAAIEGFSVTLVGMVMSAYFFGFIVGSWFCPAVIYSVGHIRAFAAFATVASAVAIAYPLVVNPYVWIILRVLTGLTIAGIYMIIESWLNVIAPNEIRGRLFALYTAITLFALGTGQYLLLLGEVAHFNLFALISILISLSLLPIVMTRINQPDSVPSPHLGLRRLAAISPLGLWTTFTAGITGGAFWGMGPLFGESVRSSSNEVGVLMSVVIFGGALLQWPIGRISDHIDRRWVMLLVALLGALFAYIAYASLLLSDTLFYLTMFLFGGTSFTIYALGVAHVNDLLQVDEMLEATRALLLVYGIGATIGPLLASAVMQQFGAIHLLGFFSAALGLLSLFTLYRLLTGRRVALSEQGEFVPMVRTSAVVLEMAPQLSEASNRENR